MKNCSICSLTERYIFDYESRTILLIIQNNHSFIGVPAITFKFDSGLKHSESLNLQQRV